MSSQPSCENCPVHHKGNLVRLGIDMDKVDYVVALAGNPNTGKSTVFNNLTGLRQHTGNWPGKTVGRAEGAFSYEDDSYKIVDLPGTYSLLSTSTDEEVARNFILFGRPDVTVIVADATRLERNLNLVLQILEITDRAILCLNLMDEAKRNHVEIDVRELSRELGIPVIPTSARRRDGMDELVAMIAQVASGKYICKPHRVRNHTPQLKHAIDTLAKKLRETYPGLPNAEWVALRLLEGDQSIIEALQNGILDGLVENETPMAI
ncbi:MAG: iron transporter FeoB [Flavobacteriia bacterium]|nr:MAG: iron transporter FeoB [Flavobacteriia bacterium]